MDSRAPRAAGGDFPVVVFAASAGGLHALMEVLGGLPAGFPAALAIVQHLDRRYPSHLAEILARRTRLAVREAKEGDRLTPGVALVAPSDRHLLVDPDWTVHLTRTELVHFVRPSADLLFESAAAACGERAIAVVLSGTGVDGAMGLTAIKKMGGTVLAQDERSAEFGGMPEAARKTGMVDCVLALEEMAPALRRLVESS